jgi:hypothetical protein
LPANRGLIGNQPGEGVGAGRRHGKAEPAWPAFASSRVIARTRSASLSIVAAGMALEAGDPGLSQKPVI